MLCEQVLAVELIALPFDRALRTSRAAVVLEAEMLGSDVSLPFILGPERAVAPSEGESAREGAGVGSRDVLAER